MSDYVNSSNISQNLLNLFDKKKFIRQKDNIYITKNVRIDNFTCQNTLKNNSFT